MNFYWENLHKISIFSWLLKDILNSTISTILFICFFNMQGCKCPKVIIVDPVKQAKPC